METLSSDDGTSSESDDELTIKLVFAAEPIAKIQLFVESVVQLYSEKTFQTHFRMHRCTAYYLVDRLARSAYIPTHLFGKEKVNPEKAFLLTLWYICNKETFRQISDRFDVSISSAHRILHRVLQFLLSVRGEYIFWPRNDEEKIRITRGFEQKRGIKNVIGGVDGCHVRINRPIVDEESYVSRKGYHSLLLQGIVDSRKYFINVYCGEPGSIHDARLLRKSHIYSVAQENPQFFGEHFLLGYSAYPSLPWLVPPFKDNGALTDNQKRFNFLHSSTRITVEHVFGLLKGRFRRLQHIENTDVITAVTLIMAACVLHNVCQRQKDDTFIEPNDVHLDIGEEPEAWATYTVVDSRREEVFRQLCG